MRAMSGDDEKSRIGVVAERLSVTPDYAQKYRRRLIDARVVGAVGRGELASDVSFLADYLRRDEWWDGPAARVVRHWRGCVFGLK